MTDRKTFFGLAAALLLAAALPASAETVSFQGKAYCPIRYDINWPFTSKVKKVAQGSGITANVYELPKESREEKSAAELGSDMSRLRIIAAPIQIGQHVDEDQALITYELPLENLMAEQQAVSRADLNKLEHAMATVRLQLATVQNRQQELENMAGAQSVAANEVSNNARDIENLLLQRDFLEEKLELARQRYDNSVLVTQSKFGKDVDLKNLPRRGYVRAPGEGYILWLNSSLVPGMAFTKQAPLITIGKLDPIIVRASVHEIAMQKLKVGDPAAVIFNAWPTEKFQTTISKVDYVAQPAMMQQPSFYLIELTLQNPDLRIKEGMRCDVVVDLH
jgi:multidrug efflux pump subunit AcrA (membrane-fusion protein)